MSHDHSARPVPKVVLWAALGLMLFSLTLAAVAQWTGYGKIRVPEGPIVAETLVRFEDLGPGGLRMVNHHSGAALAVLASGQDGFVRGVLRSMNRTRRLDRLPQDAPFSLIRYQDGRTALKDPSTEEALHLIGFGIDNLATIDALAAAASSVSVEAPEEGRP